MKKQENNAFIRISVTHNKVNDFRYMYFQVDSVLSSDVVCSIIASYSKYKRVEVLPKKSKYYKRCGQKVYTLDTLLEHLSNIKYTIKILDHYYEEVRTLNYLGKLKLKGLRMLGFSQKYKYTYMHLVSTTDCIVPCEKDILKLFRRRFIPNGDASLPGMIKCGILAPYSESYGFDDLLEFKENCISPGVYEYTIYSVEYNMVKRQKEIEIELL